MRQTCVFLLSQDKTAVEKQLHGQIVLKAVRKYTQVRAFVCSPVHHFPSSFGNLYDFDDERLINPRMQTFYVNTPDSSCPHHYTRTHARTHAHLILIYSYERPLRTP